MRIAAALFLGILFVTATGTKSFAEDKGKLPILCLGDSLTFGEGGDGTTWPKILGELSGRNVVNRGMPGWIPRHVKYRYLLQDSPFLTVEQLRGIPPQEYENRVNQPDINNLREFMKPGDSVVVRDAGQPDAVYVWDKDANQDGADFIKPTAVGDPAHKPVISTGRWVRAKTMKVESRPIPEICVIWIGANGMEADDVEKSLQDLTGDLGSHGVKVLVLGLINRLPAESTLDKIADWAKWIGECNERSRIRYDSDFIDLQAWMTCSGIFRPNGYRTLDALPQSSPLQVAEDKRDQSLGVVPDTLRNPANSTHLNAVGYRAVGKLVFQSLRDRGWL